MTLLPEWLAYARDLTWIASGAAVLLYVIKLLRPSHEIDRIAYLALAVASVGPVVTLGLALVGMHLVVPWALLVLLPLALFWVMEAEFGTRLLGLGAGLALTAVARWLGDCSALPLSGEIPWIAWARLLSLVGAGLMGAAGVVAAMRGLAAVTPVVNARRTNRFFAMGTEVGAELVYRYVAWALPFQVVTVALGALAMTRGQLAPLGEAALVVALVTGAVYATACRPSQYAPRFRPILLIVAVLAAAGALRLVGAC